MDGRFVAYYRVSTDKQDAECAAQRMAVEAYLNGGGWDLIGEFSEVETGKGADALDRRPELQKALALCRKRKATLVIAKLDRLSRNLHFTTGLIESRVNFVACDMPFANKLEIHVRAMFAEHERDMISARTKAALQAKKAAGVRLGSPNPKAGSVVGCAKQRAQADEFAAKMLPVIDGIRARGIVTLTGIAEELTRQNWSTARGRAWDAKTVSNLLKRREAHA
jgi:DNA invertase Pin-like site-specific DNA recombinase